MWILYLAITVFVAIAVFFVWANRWTATHPHKLTRDDVVNEIDSFLSGSGGRYDWDDFLTFRIADPTLDAVRQRCAAYEWQTEAGREQLRAEANRLRGIAS